MLDLTDQLLGPAPSLAKELPPAPFWVASVRVLALLAAGRFDELEHFLDLVDEAGTGSGFSESQALLHIVRGRLALLRGRPATAADHLRLAAAVSEGGSRSDLRAWASSLMAEACALRADPIGAELAWAAGGLTEAAPTPRPVHHGDAARSRAWVLAARGDRTQARAWAEAVADECRREGLDVHELSARHDALRLGSGRSTLERIVDLGGRMEGDLAGAYIEHARALALDDGDRLDAVADRFEELGALLLAAEAAAQARAAFARARAPARSSQANVRSGALAARCEGANTPLLLDRPDMADLTSRERDVASLGAAGLTSREIADRLALSRRTVDNYLQHAYRKLGITRREQLPAALDGDPRRHGPSTSAAEGQQLDLP